GQAYIQYLQSPGGLNYGGSVCDLTNVTSACILQVVGTQSSSTGATAPTTYTGIGNVQRNYATGPGYADWDMSAQKQTRIWESVAFTLRVDAFDILNHPNFGQPTGNVQSA